MVYAIQRQISLRQNDYAQPISSSELKPTNNFSVLDIWIID
jgi:hypothetical protein